MGEVIRNVRWSDEFDTFYSTLVRSVKSKYDYVIDVVRLQRVVNEKFVKRLVGTPFYELRVAVSSNEYRTIIVAVDSDSFMSATKVLLLNSFLKKSTKQYKSEIESVD